MNTSITPPGPDGRLQSSVGLSRSEGKICAAHNPSGLLVWVSLLVAGLLFLLSSAPAARAQGIPPGCTGSAIGISLFTSAPDVHVGDTLFYSASVFNGLVGNPISCDASNIVASITTPDGVIHPIVLRRTYLSHTQSDFYTNVVSYVARAQDIRPDGTLRTTAEVTATIYQNDTPSTGGANQGVNTEVSQPCVKLAVQCVGGVGENGAITFTGTVTNCGNNTLVGVVVTNFVNGGQFTVTFITNLLRGQVAPFSGSWIPLNPCNPSTATFVATGVDQFTSNPRTVTSSADATCQNTLTPGIKVTRACPPQPVAPGQLLTYSGSVSNTGNVTLTNIVVVDSQPAPNTPVFTRSSLAPGEVVSFNGSYTAPANCSVSDTLTANASSRCGVPVSDSASGTCPILTTPQIALTVLCPTTPPAAGGTLTYSGTVFNGGDISLTDIVVVSDRPTPNTTVFTVASLAPGASANFTTSVSVPADACSVTTIFRAQGKDQCTLNPVSNTVTTTCPTTTASGIAVTLVCPTVPAAAGGPITFTGTVRNSGNVTLNNVLVSNAQSVPSTVLTIPSLAPGVSANFSATFTAPADTCSVSSAVTATGSDACSAVGATANASATCPLTTTPSIEVTQVCPAGPAIPGGLLTYSGMVRNAGNVTLTNVVVLNNLSGAAPIFTAATLAAGQELSFTGSYVAPTNCSSTSTSTATGRSICGVAVNSTVSTTCPVLTAPQIAVTAVCPATPIVPGSLLTYSGTVRNTGNITLTNVVVVSDRPAANTQVFTAATLAPGASAPYTASYTVPATDCSVTTTVAATGRDTCTGTPVQNSAVITCGVATAPSIAVTLTCPTVPAAAGGPITFTGTVRNSGNVTLNNVVVSNDKSGPNSVLTVPSLAPGVSANFSATFTAPADICSVSSTVTATGTDACAATVVTDTESATCPLTTMPSIVVTQVCPTGPAIPGGLLTYSGTVRNAGNVTLTNVVVVNNLSGAAPIFTAATLAAGQELGFTGSYVAPTNCSSTSTSTATGRSVCGVAVNSTVSATCPVFTAPQIAVTAVCPATPIVPGSLLTYSGTVRNTGNITLTNVVVVSDRPVANTQVFTAATLAPGASAPYTASYTVPATDCSVTTTVAATGRDTCTGAPVQNSAVITCTVATSPSIAVTLTCPGTPAVVGGQITYSGTVRNSGNVTLNNVMVVNNQPASGTPVTGPITLAPGASAEFTTSFTAPVDTCSVSSTVTASGSDACTETVVTASSSATCPLVTTPSIAVTQNCPVGAISPGGTVTYTGSVRNTGNITLTNIVVRSGGSGITPSNTVGTTIWVDDSVPAGSTRFSSGGDSWTWVTSNPTPFSGLRAQRSNIDADFHMHGFKGATATLPINVGDTLIVYVYIDPANPTREISVAWSDGSSEHRAYWGENLINEGTDGTDSRRYMGPLPTVGQWTRLDVPANMVGLEGRRLTGMEFELYKGRVYWDAAGKISQTIQPPPNGDTVFTTATLAPGASADFTVSYNVPAQNGCSTTSTLTATAANTCTGARVTDKVVTTCALETAPAISVTQSCPTTPVLQGGVLTYSGTVHNAGNITLTNIVVSNNRPAENTVIFTVASLAPGASANFTGSYHVPINCCDVWSTVTASGKDTCTGLVVTDTDTQTCTVLTTPRIVVTKVCPSLPVPSGGTLQYSGIVSNAGNVTLVEVTIVNDQPIAGSLVFGPITLAPGEAVSYDGSYLVSPDFCGTDTVTAHGLDACTLAPVVDSVTKMCPVITAPRISVTQNCPAETTTRGGVYTFTGTVINSGNVTLNNVMVVNNYQTDCYSRTNGPVIGPITLLPGASADFSGSYTAPLSCCEVVDTLTASGLDHCTGNRVAATSSQICPLLSTPGITVTRVCPTTTVPVGGLFVYTGVVSNNGDVNLTNVTVVSSQPTANTSVLGPVELAPGESKHFSGSYIVTAESNPATDTVTARGYDLCQGRNVIASADCSGQVGSLVINSVSLANGTARVIWSATPGTVYRVQCKASSQDTNWVTIPGDVTASSAAAFKDDAVGSVQERYYRVMVVK